MNPVTQMVEHERRRFEPWPQSRSLRLPPLYITAVWPRCREPETPLPPMRLPLAEFVRELPA